MVALQTLEMETIRTTYNTWRHNPKTKDIFTAMITSNLGQYRRNSMFRKRRKRISYVYLQTIYIAVTRTLDSLMQEFPNFCSFCPPPLYNGS